MLRVMMAMVMTQKVTVLMTNIARAIAGGGVCRMIWRGGCDVGRLSGHEEMHTHL